MKRIIGHRKGGADDVDIVRVAESDSWKIEGEFIVVTTPGGKKSATRIPAGVASITEIREVSTAGQTIRLDSH